MLIDLNMDDVTTIRSALNVWEKEKSSELLSSTLLGAMFCKDSDREKFTDDSVKKMDEAKMDGELRKQSSIMLQAKLISALNKEAIQPSICKSEIA